jgi:NAD(P)H-quinone oxidoreductase subunit 5
VSAIMHAGLVNGGGFLLARFSLLFLQLPHGLMYIFIAGIITAILGNIWKLLQHDIKKMLACSTMAQMGFMFMQFGLGLFPAALTHLVFHSFFKAYLFLNADSIACEKKISSQENISLIGFLLSMICGLCGAATFVFFSHKNIATLNTNFILFLLVFITNTQIALTILTHYPVKRFLFSLMYVNGFSLFYGLSVYSIEYLLKPSLLTYPQPLNALYIISMCLFLFLWILSLFHHYFDALCTRYKIFQQLYVLMLNLSQPTANTITTHRNDYQYTFRGETSCQ